MRQREIVAGTETDVEGDFPAQQWTKVIEIKAHGMSSRKIKDSELKNLAVLGDMSGTSSEHVLALDGVAVIVNSANAAVSKMSFTQLAQVFSGAVSDWSWIAVSCPRRELRHPRHLQKPCAGRQEAGRGQTLGLQ